MEIGIATVLSVLSITFVILNFAVSRKDKASKDSGNDSYRWGAIETRLSNIEKCLDKIEKKLDTYDKETDEKIDLAIKHHIAEMHKN